MSKRAFTPEYKMEVLKVWEESTYSLAEIMKRYKVFESTIREWKYKFDNYGTEGLKESTTWKAYSRELKHSAISDYLSGNYSLREVARKYEISNESVLRGWINKYNSHREIKDTSKGRTSSMTKGRKTAWDERIQIVLDCLGNGKDYQKTAETHGVSYQQVYQWVKKYEMDGEEALKDKRGRTKMEAELTPEEKVNLQMKKLESENERLRAENLFLKKLEEIERRRK
ncbi:helix-turn-helix domain-containing protein [Lentibacillus sediminis]|uniref:helix-turn-helix domain-containing protein n=1 Tax=Lentibacillus sediminis TaxID=1940529 RepID=UPI000C1C6A45|nr:helix-turn-helix domain-containing protein [Lentibacillus sediminis]